MNINLNDYITEEDKTEIARDEFAKHCRTIFAGKFGNKENIERILSNIGYEIAYSIVDEQMGNDMKQIVSDKAVSVINGISEHTVFRAPDAWEKEASKGWVYLQRGLACF